MKFSLGTAQFGMKYGINNLSGQVSFQEIEKIIDFCRFNNINFIDTAMNYGNSEKILGKIGVKDFNIITKIPTIPSNEKDIQAWIETKFFNSLNKLNLENVYGLLIHNSSHLKDKNIDDIYSVMKALKLKGLVKKIGVSLYNPMEFILLHKKYDFDLIQAPLNLLDQRLVDADILKFLKKKNIEIHSRSIFLQGLFFMEKEKLFKSFDTWSDLWEKWFFFLEKNQISSLEVCINFQKKFRDINRVIIGVDNLMQLKKILKVASQKTNLKFPNIRSNDINLIDPRNWQ